MISATIAMPISAGLRGADGKPYGAMDLCELDLGKAGRTHPFEAPCVGYFGAERADIKAFRAQGRAERWVVDPRLMREQGNRCIAIKSQSRQRDFGPFGGNWRFGKSLRRRESGARIDDDHLEAGKACGHGKRLRDIRRADREKPYGRSLDIEKQPPAGIVGSRRSAPAAAALR